MSSIRFTSHIASVRFRQLASNCELFERISAFTGYGSGLETFQKRGGSTSSNEFM